MTRSLLVFYDNTILRLILAAISLKIPCDNQLAFTEKSYPHLCFCAIHIIIYIISVLTIISLSFLNNTWQTTLGTYLKHCQSTNARIFWWKFATLCLLKLHIYLNKHKVCSKLLLNINIETLRYTFRFTYSGDLNTP